MKKLVLWVGLLVAGLALAQTVDSVDRQIDAGQYVEAYNAASRSSSSQVLALGAKAASFQAFYVAKDSEKLGWYEKAADLARKAIKADEKNPTGYYELSRALGRQSQFKGILQALIEGIGSQMRDNLNKTLQLQPSNADAKIALALWHFEISQKGVAFLYGADARQVEPLFREGIAADPTRIIYRVEYGDALIKLGRKDDARKQLEAALAAPAPTVADKADQERGRKLLAELK